MKRGKLLIMLCMAASLCMMGCTSAEEKEAASKSLDTIKNYLAALERGNEEEMEQYLIEDGKDKDIVEVIGDIEIEGVKLGDAVKGLGNLLTGEDEEKTEWQVEYKKTKSKSFDSNSGEMVIEVQFTKKDEGEEEQVDQSVMKFEMALQDGKWLISDVETVE